jgi:signal transduction histidine kinase
MDGEAPPARVAALDLELRRAGLALEDLGGSRVAGREEPIAVAELLREQLAVWDLVARALGATLVVGDELPGVHVLGDRVRLAQAIGNLIVNALQHGGGRVELSARLTGAAVRLEVSDEGPGLPAGIVALAERREGAARHGHGLAVAASVARRHGGRLAPAPSARGARIGLELPALGVAR